VSDQVEAPVSDGTLLDGGSTGAMAVPDDPATAYQETLASYLRTHDEAALYRASLLSQALVEAGLGPDEIVAMHFDAVEGVLTSQPYRRRIRAGNDAYQFLLEVMIAYGVQYKRHMELRLAKLDREAELRTATERLQLEEAQRTAEARTDLLAIVAHELRTPITAIKGNVDLAVRSLARGRPERVPDLLENARAAIDRLSQLTGNLVEGSRRGAPALNTSATQDLVTLISQACRWARPAAVAKGLVLEWAREPRSVLVRGDADALLSVLGNLLSNAVRYTSPGGRVIVHHGLLIDDAGRAWGWMEVKDTGIGMPPEVQARIFEKFYRAPEATLQEGATSGLGLGLALVQQFVAAHDGRIDVHSVPGEGSTFRVLLQADEIALTDAGAPSADATHPAVDADACDTNEPAP
jgi:signal transduction histidine kinase